MVKLYTILYKIRLSSEAAKKGTYMIRLILGFAFAVVYLILGIVFELIALIIGLFSKKAKEKFVMVWVSVGLRGVGFFGGAKITVLHRENIPTDRAACFIGNHRSFFDIICTYPLMKRPTGYLAKINMEHVPLLSTWMRNIHCLFLDRNDIKQGLETILKAIDLIKSGVSVFVFPEGTRCREEGTMLPFHAGSFKIATRPGAPVVPVTIVNTGAIWEDHFPIVKAQRVIIDFGEPIETAGMKPADRTALPEKVRGIMMETYEKDRELIK